MNKKVTRAFAAGIFLSALALFGYESFFLADDSESIHEDTMEISNAEYAELKQSIGDLSKKNAELELENKSLLTAKQPEEQENDQSPYLLVVKEGTSSKEISEKLVAARIINDAKQFDDYLGEMGLQRYIQVGEYELTEGMDFKDVAQILTNK